MEDKENYHADLRAEYKATNDTYLHYDNYSWRVGAVLIAGVFAFWGFLIKSNDITTLLLIICSILMEIILTCWILYTFHNRFIYNYKLARLRWIEKQLRLYQHIGFSEKIMIKETDKMEVAFNFFGISGKYIELTIYLVLSIGTPIIGIGNHFNDCCLNCCLNASLAVKLTLFIFILFVSIGFWIHLMDINDKVKNRILYLKGRGKGIMP